MHAALLSEGLHLFHDKAFLRQPVMPLRGGGGSGGVLGLGWSVLTEGLGAGVRRVTWVVLTEVSRPLRVWLLEWNSAGSSEVDVLPHGGNEDRTLWARLELDEFVLEVWTTGEFWQEDASVLLYFWTLECLGSVPELSQQPPKRQTVATDDSLDRCQEKHTKGRDMMRNVCRGLFMADWNWYSTCFTHFH